MNNIYFQVINWSHSIIKQVAEARYNPAVPSLDEAQTATKTIDVITEILAQYYSNKWTDNPKPFQYSKKQLKRTGLLNPFGEALRFVPRHSTMYLTLGKDGAIVTSYNQRKMSVLLDAYLSLIRSNIDGALELLQDFTKFVIFDYDMIYALLKCKRLADLVEMQELCAIAIPPQCEQELMRRELFLFSEYIIQDSDYLKYNADSYGAFLLSQCLDFYGLLPNLSLFIDNVDSAGRDHCALLPTAQHIQTCVSRAQCRVIEHCGRVWGAVCTEMCIYSLSERLIAARYELSGYTTIYNKTLYPPVSDHFRLLVAAKGRWDAGFDAASDNTENVILYLALTNRPHIYVIKGSDGDELRVMKCEEFVKPVIQSETSTEKQFHIDQLIAIGSQNGAAHLLCIIFQDGRVYVVHSLSSAVVYQDNHCRLLVSCVDHGYFKGCHVIGLGDSTGCVTWLCWNNLAEDMSSHAQNLQPVVTVSSLPVHTDQSISSIEPIIENYEMRSDLLADSWNSEFDGDDAESTSNVHMTGFTEFIHLIVCTSQGSMTLHTDVIEITYGLKQNSIIINNHHTAVNKVINSALPDHEPIKCFSAKMALSKVEVKNIIAACATARNAHLITFDRTNMQAIVTHSFNRTFDKVLLRNGLLIGSFGSCLELFNVTEHDSMESVVVQHLVELDEQRGEVTQIYASDTAGSTSQTPSCFSIENLIL